MTFYGSQFIDDRLPVEGTEVKVDGLAKPAVVNSDGMYIFGNDGKKVRKVKWISSIQTHNLKVQLPLLKF